MAKKHPYEQRLLLFAEKLNSMQVREPLLYHSWIFWEENGVEKTYFVSFDLRLFHELPNVFKGWVYYKPVNEVHLKRHPKHLGMVGMVMKFFDLKPEEFIFLFEIDNLVKDTSQAISHKIHSFLKV